jgi:hypothetical protein
MNVSKGTRFKVFEHGDDTVSFQSQFGLFISLYDPGTGHLGVNAKAANEATKFYPIGNGLNS